MLEGKRPCSSVSAKTLTENILRVKIDEISGISSVAQDLLVQLLKMTEKDRIGFNGTATCGHISSVSVVFLYCPFLYLVSDLLELLVY